MKARMLKLPKMLMSDRMMIAAQATHACVPCRRRAKCTLIGARAPAASHLPTRWASRRGRARLARSGEADAFLGHFWTLCCFSWTLCSSLCTRLHVRASGEGGGSRARCFWSASLTAGAIFRLGELSGAYYRSPSRARSPRGRRRRSRQCRRPAGSRRRSAARTSPSQPAARRSPVGLGPSDISAGTASTSSAAIASSSGDTILSTACFSPFRQPTKKQTRPHSSAQSPSTRRARTRAPHLEDLRHHALGLPLRRRLRLRRARAVAAGALGRRAARDERRIAVDAPPGQRARAAPSPAHSAPAGRRTAGARPVPWPRERRGLRRRHALLGDARRAAGDRTRVVGARRARRRARARGVLARRARHARVLAGGGGEAALGARHAVAGERGVCDVARRAQHEPRRLEPLLRHRIVRGELDVERARRRDDRRGQLGPRQRGDRRRVGVGAVVDAHKVGVLLHIEAREEEAHLRVRRSAAAATSTRRCRGTCRRPSRRCRARW